MVPRREGVSENLGPILKSPEAFVLGLEVSFLGDFASLSLGFFLSLTVLNFETQVLQFDKVSNLQFCTPVSTLVGYKEIHNPSLNHKDTLNCSISNPTIGFYATKTNISKFQFDPECSNV